MIGYSSGYVGIGTTSPSSILHTYGSNPTLLLQTSTAGYGSGSATIQFITSSANYPLAQIKAIDMGVSPNVFRGDLVFYSQFNTTLNEAMRIQNGGNVGIGTASPGYTLAINGTLGLVHTGLTNTNQIQFNNSTTTYTIQQVDNAGANYLRLGRNGFGDIVINSTGRIGIGKTNPSTTLDITGGLSINNGVVGPLSPTEFQGVQISYVGSGVSGYGQIVAINPGTTYTPLCLNPFNQGNVGIGTASPSSILHVTNSANSTSYTDRVTMGVSDGPADAGTTYGMINLTRPHTVTDNKGHSAFIRSGQMVYMMGYLHTSNTMGWVRSDTMNTSTGIFMTSTGNVGIGITNPSTTLHVNGSLNVSGLNVSGAILGTMLSQYTYTFNTSSSTMNLTTTFGINIASTQTSRFFLVSITNDWGGSARSDGSLFFLFIPSNNTGVFSYWPIVSAALMNGATGSYTLTVSAYNTITVATGQWTTGVTTTVVLTRLSI
jgi:hypothetical protein